MTLRARFGFFKLKSGEVINFLTIGKILPSASGAAACSANHLSSTKGSPLNMALNWVNAVAAKALSVLTNALSALNLSVILPASLKHCKVLPGQTESPAALAAKHRFASAMPAKARRPLEKASGVYAPLF